VSEPAASTSPAATSTVHAGGAFADYSTSPSYAVGQPYDECFTPEGATREGYGRLVPHLASLSQDELQGLTGALDRTLHSQGITFTVQHGESEGGDMERTLPLDLVPRLIPSDEWQVIEQGLAQRLRALNAFLGDVYSAQEVMRDDIVPTELVVAAKHFTRQVWGVRPPHDLWVHVYGPDVVRGADGTWMVLEDNCRTPSGVSYVIENRAAMLRVFPELFARERVAPVDHYPHRLLDVLRSVAPHDDADARVVVLTPGSFNSAYSEHTFLGRQMGVDIVEGGDLFVDDAVLYMKTTHGRRRVDVVYRRVDDDFLDPLEFRHDSYLGVTGLMTAARAGNVTIANAVGTGLADDKAIFPFVPAMIQYYLGEAPLLDQVPTYQCRLPDELDEVLGRLDELVVKPVAESGGYGVTIGPLAGDEEIAQVRQHLQEKPGAYIAQPTISLSTHPTLCPREDGTVEFAPRHVDLRMFLLAAPDGEVHAIPGGLSRVALPEGALVVNSSQGGGSKDTWVVPGGGL
jgi:uncharacterized circularly permuted ATP-grasp superfamily protein